MGYAIIAGRNPRDSVTERQSAVHLSGFELNSLEGVRIGVCRPYLEDAEAAVVARCNDALMRFIRLANVTGLPAISVPAGHDECGLPVGVQLMARPREEHLLFRLARAVEAANPQRTPALHVRALSR